MSNRQTIRELNGGRLTRPRHQWNGKPRGRRAGLFAADMQRMVLPSLGGSRLETGARWRLPSIIRRSQP